MSPRTPHPGSFDLDLGVEIGIDAPETLEAVEAQLTLAGFAPGFDRHGQETRDTWRYPVGTEEPRITVDLIVAGSSARAWLPEIRFAFADRDRVRVEGADFAGRDGSGELWVCGIASFMLLKGLAYHRRTLEKDAFDIYWCLKHWPNAWNEVHERMAGFMPDHRAREILGFMADDFEAWGPGANAAGLFSSGAVDDDVSADATGLVERMLRTVNFL